jgi:hypothetical protein
MTIVDTRRSQVVVDENDNELLRSVAGDGGTLGAGCFLRKVLPPPGAWVPRHTFGQNDDPYR